MAKYSKTNFRNSRKSQYHYFKLILNYSILGVAIVLLFLMFMLKFAWS